MENDIKFLRVQNFKSIKDVTLHPRRVNLIIGEPNVGKSNLLEAMTLLGDPNLSQLEKFMGRFIRYEATRQLFYNNLTSNPISISSNIGHATIRSRKISHTFDFTLKGLPLLPTNNDAKGVELSAHNMEMHISFDAAGLGGIVIKVNSIQADEDPVEQYPVRPYFFLKDSPINYEFAYPYLNSPNGSNLLNVIQNFSSLRKEIASMFARYDQKLQLRMDERRVEIIKDQDGIIYSFPYSSVADTLQRIIFYLAAIESNDNAVLLFEEPEAHSFPVYVSKLGRRIVESRNNQFFIDTHSPYLITEILETMLTDDAQAGELAMFAAYYEDHQTKVHQLSDEEIRSIRADGIDVFYNMKRFTTGAASNA
jgi:AAA15 family ATPase/GTPase